MVDYSKWKNIEISDDEDETHPNIDTPSLFRWRHNARIERMEQQHIEREKLEERKALHKANYESTMQQLAELDVTGKQDSNLTLMMQQLEKEGEELKHEEEELMKREELMPWNVDTISQPGFSKTIVNVPKPAPKEELSAEEKEKRLKDFVKENENLVKQYGMLQKYDVSKQFLMEHPHLACDETATYLVLWCINLEIEEKHNLMHHVAHQTICMQYIMELAKQLDMDPRSCISSFFSRIQTADPEYKDAFHKEIETLKERVTARAQDKLNAAMKEAEEEERKERLGPGGLDPVEVMETLPEELKQCFESRDVKLLQETIAKMEKEEAVYYMKRCVDSGLWVPESKKSAAGDDDVDSAEVNIETEEFLEAKTEAESEMHLRKRK